MEGVRQNKKISARQRDKKYKNRKSFIKKRRRKEKIEFDTY